MACWNRQGFLCSVTFNVLLLFTSVPLNCHCWAGSLALSPSFVTCSWLLRFDFCLCTDGEVQSLREQLKCVCVLVTGAWLLRIGMSACPCVAFHPVRFLSLPAAVCLSRLKKDVMLLIDEEGFWRLSYALNVFDVSLIRLGQLILQRQTYACHSCPWFKHRNCDQNLMKEGHSCMWHFHFSSPFWELTAVGTMQQIL